MIKQFTILFLTLTFFVCITAAGKGGIGCYAGTQSASDDYYNLVGTKSWCDDGVNLCYTAEDATGNVSRKGCGGCATAKYPAAVCHECDYSFCNDRHFIPPPPKPPGKLKCFLGTYTIPERDYDYDREVCSSNNDKCIKVVDKNKREVHRRCGRCQQQDDPDCYECGLDLCNGSNGSMGPSSVPLWLVLIVVISTLVHLMAIS